MAGIAGGVISALVEFVSDLESGDEIDLVPGVESDPVYPGVVLINGGNNCHDEIFISINKRTNKITIQKQLGFTE